ncbi:MAG: hypothetical protein JSS89_12225 [Bacteroidetes bacterium]|nr:hypothetical protein [Bacteroidota bacterium]
MATDEATVKRPRAKRIDKRRNYVFGPVPRGYEFENDSEMVTFSTRAENGINYPREYPGSYFTDSLAVNTFEEYLSRNPENLKPGARFFFYEKNDDGTASLITSGTMMPPQSYERMSQLSDASMANVPQGTTMHGAQHPIIINTPNGPTTNDRHNRAAMEDLVETMRAEIDSLREQVAVKDRRIDEMQRSVIDAEQKRLAAEAQLTVALDKHQHEIDALKERHAADLDTLKQLHEKDVDIIARKAADAAQQQMNEKLSDMETKETAVDKAMEMISDFSPILTPIANKLGEVGGMLLEDWIEQVRERRAKRRGLPSPSQHSLPAARDAGAIHGGAVPAQAAPEAPPQAGAVDASSIFNR